METSRETGISFGVLILAAGRSTRMGRPKLLLPWGEATILAHLLQTWIAVGAAQIAVVCDEKNLEVSAELERLRFPEKNRIYNPVPERGMFSSIQAGAKWPGWSSNLSHYAIVLGDQPHVRRTTLKRLVEFCTANRTVICQPSFQEQARHPVFFPKNQFGPLAVTTRPTLRAHLSDGAVVLCEIDDSGLEVDIDRPEDYAKALAIAGLTTADARATM